MANLSEQIIGTWIGISHQSITVITFNVDGTIYGTYQTPSINLKSTFDGKWLISNNILQSHYTNSSPRIPFLTDTKYQDKVTIDGDKMSLEGIGSSDIELVRVKYKEHRSVERRKESMSKIFNAEIPSVAQLESIDHDNLLNNNDLLNWIYRLIEEANGDLHDEKVINALINSIPKKSGYYYAILTFEGLWGNGGMQSVMLPDDLESSQTFLNIVESAYRHFGSVKTADLINDLIPKSKKWSMEIEKYIDEEPPYMESQKIWDQIDNYDDIYEKTIESDKSVWDALLEDIHNNPIDYINKSNE